MHKNQWDETADKCRISYDTYGRLRTKSHFPFNQLSDCNKHVCKSGEFQCIRKKFCIPIQYVCDGINHCIYNDDETDCS